MALFEDTFPPFVPFGSRTLSGGEKGTDVAVLQTVYDEMLKVMNPPLGPLGQPIPVTGTYDAATVQAVKNVQSFFGITVDGVAGPNTYFLFGQGVGPHVTYGGPAYGSRSPLGQGDQGGDVTVLQNRLNLFRYSSALGGPADGVYGPKTSTAVSQLQADAVANGDTGLPVNGVVGSATLDATWIYTYAGGRGIFTGRNGFDVVFIQVLLKKLGFYSGPIQGYYDAATRAAVIAFQTAAGISADGVIGQSTYFALGQRNLVPAPLPLPVPPIGPSQNVTACSVALTSQSSDLHPFGVAAHVINVSEGFESLDVVGNMLPEPSSFGSQFGQYAFTLTDPATGMVVEQELMVRLPGGPPSDWAGSFSPGVKSIPNGVVTVLPTPTGSATGPYGPAVLAGNLANCH